MARIPGSGARHSLPARGAGAHGSGGVMSRVVLPADPLVEAATALRAWRDSDAAALIRICQDPDIVRWTSVPPNYSESDARTYLLHRHDAILAGTAAPFA